MIRERELEGGAGVVRGVVPLCCRGMDEGIGQVSTRCPRRLREVER